MVERTDWNFPVPVKPHEQALPGARDLTPSQQISAGEAVWDTTPAVVDDPLAGLTDDQIEQAAIVIGMIIGADDPTGFAAVFDTMSPSLQSKVFGVMARSPHLRGLDLVDAIEKKLTLSEAAEAETWLRNLSPEHKQLLRG